MSADLNPTDAYEKCRNIQPREDNLQTLDSWSSLFKEAEPKTGAEALLRATGISSLYW